MIRGKEEKEERKKKEERNENKEKEGKERRERKSMCIERNSVGNSLEGETRKVRAKSLSIIFL